MSVRPRLMLITPPYHSGVVEAAMVCLPLNFVHLAAHARRAGAEVRIYDAMSLWHSHEDIAREIEAFRPDVVATTAITAMEPDAREICRTAKRLDPGTITILGNVHPTFCCHQILSDDPDVDLVARGEGEGLIEDVVRAVAAGGGAAEWAKIRGLAWRRDGAPFANPPRPFVRDLDTLEAAWDLLDWSLYFYRPHPEGRFALTSTSRGCMQRCSFCSQQKFWQQSWRGRDPLRVVEELELLRDRHGVRVAMLSDETPTADLERWTRLLDLVVERQVGVELLMETRVADILRDEALLPRYVEAGISHVYLGVESTRQAALDLYKKDIKVAESKRAIELVNAHGMVTETAMVLGTPDETPETIRETLELLKWYGPDMGFFMALTPWPYSDLGPELDSRVETRDYRQYNLIEPVMRSDAMSRAELKQAFHDATVDFFHDKFKNLHQLPPHKRKFMMRVCKILIENSYLAPEMKRMVRGAEMPEFVRRYFAQFEEEDRRAGRLPERQSA